MDILSHAIAGASAGYYFGKPLEGAIIAVLPDVTLGIKRRKLPTEFYLMQHSLMIPTLLGVFGIWWAFWPYLSHVVLDLFTHGEQWNPRLLYPLKYRLTSCTEWEFFNKSWCIGFAITISWSTLWIIM